MTITFESIATKQSALETAQAELGAMIAQFRQQSLRTEAHLPAAVIPLEAGERLAGLVLTEDGEPSHYLIKLPGEAVDMNFAAARDWASQQGGELPTRQEQALLYANLKGEFAVAWYWSGEEKDDGFAWCQSFRNGGQSYGSQSYEFRAVAVRRFSPPRCGD